MHAIVKRPHPRYYGDSSTGTVSSRRNSAIDTASLEADCTFLVVALGVHLAYLLGWKGGVRPYPEAHVACEAIGQPHNICLFFKADVGRLEEACVVLYPPLRCLDKGFFLFHRLPLRVDNLMIVAAHLRQSDSCMVPQE